MSYKVGIIGPEDLVRQSTQISKKFKNISPVLLSYKNEQETPDIIKENWDNIDIYLFTGFLPYFKATHMGLDKLAFYFPIAGTSLYKTLFEMQVHQGIDIRNISIDTLKSEEVFDIYKELNVDNSQVKINQTELKNFCKNKFSMFHKQLFDLGKTEAAITAINSVYERLKSYGVEVFKLVPTPQSMEKTFQFISTFIDGEKARDNQLIMQIIHLSYENDNDKFQRKEKELKFYEQLLNYGKEHYSSVFFNENNEYIILMNLGIFKKYTNFYNSIPIIGKIKKELELSVFMGVGMGHTVIEAEVNAREALEISKEQKNGNAYIIDHEKNVVGPLDLAENRLFSFKLKSSNQDLIKIAEKSDLSISTLSKIQNLINDLGNNQITSKVIKDNFKVTLRTANRIINKLLSSELAREVGYEDSIGRGRPRRIYEIDIPQL